MPKKFTDWVDRNAERIKSAKSLPYFIKDNFSYHAISKYIEVKSSKTPVAGGGNPLEPLTKIQRKKYDSINTPTGVNDDSLSSAFVKGKPMPHGEANKGNVNPGFSLEKDGLNNNCACCVMAYIARRNGYNVRAAMRNNELLEDLASHPEKAWIRADKTIPKFKRAGGVDNNIKEKIVIKNRAQMLEEFESLTQKRGLYQIWYKSIISSQEGHTIIIERLANLDLLVYDGQNGKMYKWKDFVKQIGNTEGINILALEGLSFNPEFVSALVPQNRQ